MESVSPFVCPSYVVLDCRYVKNLLAIPCDSKDDGKTKIRLKFSPDGRAVGILNFYPPAQARASLHVVLCLERAASCAPVAALPHTFSPALTFNVALNA